MIERNTGAGLWNKAKGIILGGLQLLSKRSEMFLPELWPLFTQLMLEKGFLASTAFYSSFAHKEEYIKSYLKASDEAFGFISKSIAEGKTEKYLKGPICHAGFKRLT